MKTEREIRLKSELKKASKKHLGMMMFDLNEGFIDNLVSEAGHSGATSYINDGNGWSRTLAETITDLVASLYTLDNVTYDSIAELEAAALSSREQLDDDGMLTDKFDPQ